MGRQLAHYGVHKRRGVHRGRRAVPQAVVDADKQLFFAERFYLHCATYGIGLSGVRSLNGTEDGFAVQAGPPAPGMVGALLVPGIGDFRVKTTIYTYHVCLPIGEILVLALEEQPEGRIYSVLTAR